MKQFKDKVAVVTGAASGIGKSIAERAAQKGMKVVLADIEQDALKQTEAEMKGSGADVIAVVTDVSKQKDLEVLAEKALSAYKQVHLLVNNAGVAGGGGGSIWESDLSAWQWVMGVNLWGVIHGIRVFVPIMLDQGDECHIVNTASIAGLISSHGAGIYKVTKHGVVTLSETLHHELEERNAKVRVSVVCPGFVKTRIMEAQRNRPAELKGRTPQRKLTPVETERGAVWLKAVQEAMPPSEVADAVFAAIAEGRFYVLTHQDWKHEVRTRMEDILNERAPTDVFIVRGL